MKLSGGFLFIIALLSCEFVFAQKDSLISTVYFRFDKYSVLPEFKEKLLYELQPYEGIDSISVIGFTDAKGNYAYNDQLSMKRANAVKDFLVSTKFPNLISVSTAGWGKRKLQVPDLDSNWRNRLAVVIAYLHPEPEPEKPVVQPTPQPVTAVLPKPVQPGDTIPTETPHKATDEIVPITTLEPVRMPTIINSVGEGKELNEKVRKVFDVIQPKQSIVLTTINFVEGRHVFVKESDPALKAALEALKSLPSVEVELQGHVCCADPVQADLVDLDTKEFKLSYNRARAVYDYMVKNGIDPKRMTYKGFAGRRRLVFPEKTTADANKNRRVEFFILKK